MTLRRLVLWRHGQTEYNVSGRIQGHLDIELTPAGQRQAQRAAPEIAAFEPSVALSSDLCRATATASAFTTATGMPVTTDKRLREVLFGEWQGLALDELERAWPGGFQRWRSDPEYRPPGGESQVQLAERALDVVRELDRVHDGTALLCTHGGVIRSATASLLRLPKDQWLCLSSVGNCHWTVFARQDVGGRWRLATYNGGLPE